jgi:ABC-type Fe3+/spermidine/putrescine transport system ATPase subunit
VAQHVAFGLEERKRPRQEIEQRVSEALSQVKLEGLGSRKIQQLSGGQQQRVALARALVIRPKCLLLDEPLSNLDAKLRLEMRGEIRSICKQHGLTAIYVTHDRDEALSMADRMAIMESGKLVQVGTPTEVYRNPATRMVAEFIGETNFVEGRALRESSWAGYFDVETAFGVLRGRTNDSTWQPSPGQPVVLSIRPEAMTFANLTDSTNRFPGRLIDTTYLGPTVQYLLQVQNGPLMKVCEINPKEIRPPSEEEVRAMAGMNDVVILRK